jgi:predicted Zn finger-like uncharacterized protein
MTLATRCPACGTSFRVVQDQLKVSEGWVRCGRCNEVFNAIEALFDTDTTTPVPAGAAPVLRAPHSTPPQPPQSSSFDSTQAQETMAPASEADDDLVDANEDPIEAPQSADAPWGSRPDRSPAFVRRANQAAAWERPQVRVALVGAAAMLGLALAAQAALLYRDTLAVRWPESRPLLDAACAWTGCRVEPLRRIGALAVDASGLNPLEGSSGYRLSVVLRNRSDVELLLPAFDLLLTDSQGRTIARRMLGADELGAPSRTLAAGAELALQSSLEVGERRVSGYTIEIFYP